MPKDAPGRNDPCPCGSGKKYKKCCQGKEPAGGGSAAERPSWDRLPSAERARIAKEARRLDDLSNGAVDAIEAKRFDEAEKLCESLLREYPDMIDGHERLGMLREAQGRFQEAAQHYDDVLARIEQDPSGFDPQIAAEFRKRREEALAMSRKGDRHSRAQETRIDVVRGEDLSIKGEAEYIVGQAYQGEARLVTLGPLIFFSTATRDAWMLDREDGLAVCLARDGELQAYSLRESANGYAIEWTGRFKLDGETFVYVDNAGHVRSVLGYPIAEIRRAII